MPYCTHCGRLVPPGVNFCSNCGGSVAGSAVRRNNTVVEEYRRPRAYGGLLALNIIFTILMIFTIIADALNILLEIERMTSRFHYYVDFGPIIIVTFVVIPLLVAVRTFASRRRRHLLDRDYREWLQTHQVYTY